ncbi:MAG: hypothetical protein IJ131_02885, partial [Eggerthellaceae bacterium]|nr:hypothetical protein [Eggerthellaceae bacterium]
LRGCLGDAQRHVPDCLERYPRPGLPKQEQPHDLQVYCPVKASAGAGLPPATPTGPQVVAQRRPPVIPV